jgi:hypothetical protein
MMNKIILLILALLLISGLPSHVLAGDFDGSKPLLCAVTETVECTPDSECLRGEAESIDMPAFLKIDFAKKTISGTRQDGSVRTTEIKIMERVDGNLILQGVQNGKGWTMVISEATGKATITASDNQVGFVVFGACIGQ